jgi:uncharacterized membrane protein YoaK (UPF0700 family)
MRSRAQIYIAGYLTWIAGFVDAAGFVALGRIYTANMSGNSVAIGIQGWDQNWLETVRRAWPVAVYVVGLLCGRILLEIGGREKVRRVAGIAFGIEIAALLPVSFAHSFSHSQTQSALVFGFIALLSFAMGMQNATLTHFSNITLHTGFVTGTLVKMAEQFTKYLTWSYDQFRRERRPFGEVLRNSITQDELGMSVLLGLIWTAYVVGAFCGAAGHSFAGLKCLFVPIAALFILALYDLRQPIAVKDENEQIKVQ